MFESNKSIKALVIQGYLHGKSRDQIARDVGISGGKVSEIIKEWARAIGEPNVEEIRDFAVILNKSGVTPKESAEGFRMLQLLKKLGINGETETETDPNGGNDNNDRDANREILSFLDDIYLPCKRYRISPLNVFSWIRDLQGFCGHSHDNNNHCDSLASDNLGHNQGNHNEGEDYGYQQQQQQWAPDTKPNTENPPAENGILFISRVPQYIAQRKKEYRRLVENKQGLIKEIDNLYTIRDKAKQNYTQIYKKEKFALSHIDLFSKLKRELYDGHGIKIEQDIQGFAKMY